MNSTATNNGTADYPVPFMATEMYQTTLCTTLYALLPSDLTAVISDKKGVLGTKYSATATLTNDTGTSQVGLKLWLPTEIEILGFRNDSDNSYASVGSGFNHQYELFRKYPEQIFKGYDTSVSENGIYGYDWWLMSERISSSIAFNNVTLNGGIAGSVATQKLRFPLCFRIGG